MNPVPRPSEGLNALVAAEIRALQGRRKMSGKKLAKAADMPYGTLRRYLTAERQIDVSVLAVVSKALNTTPESIVASARRHALDADVAVSVEKGEDINPEGHTSPRPEPGTPRSDVDSE